MTSGCGIMRQAGVSRRSSANCCAGGRPRAGSRLPTAGTCVENFLRAKAHYLADMLKSMDRPIVLWGAGKTGRRLSKHLGREGLHLEAVIDIDEKKTGHLLRGIPIVTPQYLHSGVGFFVIAAVSSHAARELIRDYLVDLGFVETTDFVCAA